MAGWLAKEQNGTEVIFKHKPHRFLWFDNKGGKWSDEKWHYEHDHNYQGTWHTVFDHHNSRIILPKGSIKKLIGRELSWKDEPVKFK